MKFLKIIGKLSAVFTGIMISIVTFIMIIYISINNYMIVDNLKKTINTKNLLKIEYDDSTLKDDLIKSFYEIGISENDMNDVIESNEFNDLFDDYLDKAMKYYIENSEFPTFDEEKINKLVDLITSKSDITSEQKKYINDTLKKEKIEIEKTLPKREEIIDDNDISDIINVYNSISIFYFIGTIVILMFLIFIFTWSLHLPFLYAGISFSIPSIIIIIISLFKNIIINSFKLEEFISLMLKQAFNQLLISSLIVLFVGILFVGLYIIVNKINRRNNGNT